MSSPLRCLLLQASVSSPALSSRLIVLPHIPELHDKNFLDVLVPSTNDDDMVVIDTEPSAKPSAPRNAMMDALESTSHRTLTENGAPAYNSTLSPILDAFNGLSRYSFGSIITHHLSNSWKEDPALTLRLIWNLRSIHDGLREKELFYRAFGWLYDNHPRTAIANLHLLVDPVCHSPKKQTDLPHGYWKDLLNILALATVDELSNISRPPKFLHCPRSPFLHRVKASKPGDPASHIEESLRAGEEGKERAAAQRKLKATESHKRLVEKLEQPKFRALYIAVARLFAEQLVEDVKVLSEIQSLGPEEETLSLRKKISFAGKWAPTPGGAHDRVTNITTAISELIYASRVFPPPAALSDPLPNRERALILRSVYQRWVLTELRRISACPEPLMSAGRWTEIRYSRVPSIAMKNNTPHFFKHDPKGFEEYLTLVETSKKSMSGATLLPHELVAQIVELHHPSQDKKAIPAMLEFKEKLRATQLRVVEAQWKTLVENLRSSGALDNCLAICDVSGSMGYLGGKFNKRHVQPILPAVSLSLILASITAPPFNGGFITFSSRPQFVKLDFTQSLYHLVNTMVRTDWEMNTNLSAVFLDLLLPPAIQNQVKPEDMIKRLFIFSDMQFDECQHLPGGASSTWTANYDVIEQAYKNAGYEVPQIVFWDLQNHGGLKTVEVESDRKGVAMMNGFSPSMLKVFMGEEDMDDTMEWQKVDENGTSVTAAKEEDPFTLLNMMKKALLRKSYDGLVILD